MTIADNARNQAISLEAKKDALAQRQNGDWKVSFTVQGVDMNPRLTQAPMGTRFAMVLVEIGDDELPVQQPAKESKSTAAPPEPIHPPARAKRDWRELAPSTQAFLRGKTPAFWAFLSETKGFLVKTPEDAAEAVRKICYVTSRSLLDTEHKQRMLWVALDNEFQAWERVGA